MFNYIQTDVFKFIIIKLCIFVLRAILGKPLYSLDKEDEEGL